MPFYPDWVIVTACIPGCSSRISWDYDEGEPQTREHPGVPSEVFPARGCNENHLFALSMPYDYPAQTHDAWQRANDYDRWLAASHLSKLSSMQYIAGLGATVTLDHAARTIGGTRKRIFQLPKHPVWEPADADDLDDLPF